MDAYAYMFVALSAIMNTSGWYAVFIGRCPGEYSTWEDCEREVKGFSGSKHRKYASEKLAWEAYNYFMETGKTQPPVSPVTR